MAFKGLVIKEVSQKRKVRMHIELHLHTITFSEKPRPSLSGVGSPIKSDKAPRLLQLPPIFQFSSLSLSIFE
jgi:hypothetical protein